MNTGACGAGGVEGLQLAIVSTENRAKREAVLAAAKHDGLPLEFASVALRADNEVVEAAVEHKKPGLTHVIDLVVAPTKFDARKDIVVAVVKHHGWDLRQSSTELKADKEVVLVAKKHKGWDPAQRMQPAQNRETSLGLVIHTVCGATYDALCAARVRHFPRPRPGNSKWCL